jgi:hypothetical protein
MHRAQSILNVVREVFPRALMRGLFTVPSELQEGLPVHSQAAHSRIPLEVGGHFYSRWPWSAGRRPKLYSTYFFGFILYFFSFLFLMY